VLNLKPAQVMQPDDRRQLFLKTFLQNVALFYWTHLN